MKPSEETVLDGEQNQPGTCFSCERFIGPAEVCPYCDADAPSAGSRRALRFGALLLALAGLVWLHATARYREPPVVAMDRLGPAMNFARVRIAGEVQRDAYVSPREGEPDYLSFVVSDGAGQVRVQAWREVAAALAAENRLPRRGDRVDVEGRLRLSAQGEPRLALDSAHHVRFAEEPSP